MALAQLKMQWSQLINIPRWTQVSELGFGVYPVRDTLFQVRVNCYLIAVPHNQQLQTFAGANFVTGLLWAESEGAALRAALKEIEVDHRIVGVAPPRELLLAEHCLTYGEVINFLKSTNEESYTEVAAYRVGDGAFVHREIHAPKLHFYFRHLNEERDENPYAILRQLQNRT